MGKVWVLGKKYIIKYNRKIITFCINYRPSSYLASHTEYPVGGLIIHSGFTSGLRIMVNDLKHTHY